MLWHYKAAKTLHTSISFLPQSPHHRTAVTMNEHHAAKFARAVTRAFGRKWREFPSPSYSKREEQGTKRWALDQKARRSNFSCDVQEPRDFK